MDLANLMTTDVFALVNAVKKSGEPFEYETLGMILHIAPAVKEALPVYDIDKGVCLMKLPKVRVVIRNDQVEVYEDGVLVRAHVKLSSNGEIQFSDLLSVEFADRMPTGPDVTPIQMITPQVMDFLKVIQDSQRPFTLTDSDVDVVVCPKPDGLPDFDYSENTESQTDTEALLDELLANQVKILAALEKR